MSNRLREVALALTLISTLSNLYKPVFADQQSKTIFEKLDKQALQQWHQKPSTEEKVAHQESIEQSKVLKNDVHDLTPEQLVDLIKDCRQKIHEIPSDSQHEKYFDYFEQAIKFSIRRLGELNTSAAQAALEKVKPVIKGSSSLMLTFDEVKAKQKSK